MENLQITKQDDNTINVVKTMPVSFAFTPEYLKTQREAILKSKQDFCDARDKEIEEIDFYLSEMTKLGVVEKTKEVEEVVEKVINE